MLFNNKLFILFQIALLTFGTCVSSESYFGSAMSNNFNINYDIELEHPIYSISSTDKILYKDELNLIFESVKDMNINDIVASSDNFVGKIVSKNNNQYTVVPHELSNIIKNGKINIVRNNATMNKNGDIDIPWCYGFNTDKSKQCRAPTQVINLFKNDVITANCDNCFSGVSGDIFIDIEFNMFKITKFQFGLKNLRVDSGIGIDVDGKYMWSYAYNKVYKILDNFKIVSFKIGVISFDIYADFPVQLDFNAFANYHANINYGVNLNVDIGNLFIDYYKGTWNIIKPSPNVSITPYVSALTTISGGAHFDIIPSLSIYSPSIFDVHFKFDPNCDLTTYGSTTQEEICINGKYDMSLTLGATILKEKIPDKVIYDSGSKTLFEKCKKF